MFAIDACFSCAVALLPVTAATSDDARDREVTENMQA
jgi:hypothetical protein